MERNGGAAATATPSWEELLGSNNWSDLLSPLDETLRDHLLRCGSFCQIAGDSFISDSQSNNVGKCRYSPASILRQVFFKETADYVVDVLSNVDGYLYTTIVLPFGLAYETNWMGYVAVSSDDLYERTGRREIYVAWCGTSLARPLEWLADLDIVLVPFGDGGDVKIMKGWRDIYTTENIIEQIPSAQEKLKAVIKEYVDLYKDQNPSIICVGHSLGGSLTVVSAFDIANSGLSEINGNDHIRVCAVAFDAPRVGNQAFNDALEKLPKTKVLRINNNKDIVAYWPPCDGYVDTAQWHALQVILHTVTGWRTEFDNDSELVKARLPLVNRSAGHLKAEHKVIEAWTAALVATPSPAACNCAYGLRPTAYEKEDSRYAAITVLPFLAAGKRSSAILHPRLFKCSLPSDF
ncbi:phospholipase A1-II 5-like [Zingiber officinale]|uniref:phospholipase A1-II 5-like n=1 Tax=Zingiber officinale TaxID=94328 RepID=UPI001C4BB06B|nr:phospholipase A1-II 5-like [Zingiber officinale]